jgi:cysteine desulfuration protein SufE
VLEVAEGLKADFLELPEQNRLDFLLELADELPTLPAAYADHPDLLERVEECQSPVYLFVEADPGQKVRVFLTAPAEAPTTRGFASILQKILDNQDPTDVLAFSDDYPSQLGLTSLVSPLRIHGMQGMLRRIKRQVRTKSGQIE